MANNDVLVSTRNSLISMLLRSGLILLASSTLAGCAQNSVFGWIQDLFSKEPEVVELLWSYPISDAAFTTPIVSNDSTVYVAESTGRVLAIKDGELAWSYHTGNPIYASLAIDNSSDLLLVGTIRDLPWLDEEEGTLYALNFDGTLEWEFETEGAIYYPSVPDKQKI